MVFKSMLTVDKNKIGEFTRELFSEYLKRGEVYYAISKALWKIMNEIRAPIYYSQLIITGNVFLPEGADFNQEVILGRLVKVEPDTVVFFPGEDLADDEKRKYFFGIAVLELDKKKNLAIACRNLKADCHIGERNGVKQFCWQWGHGQEPGCGRFLISEEMFGKIQKFFNK